MSEGRKSKHDLVESLRHSFDLTHDQATGIVDELFIEMGHILNESTRLTIRNFGTFIPIPHQVKKVYNINTKEVEDIVCQPTVHFKASPNLRKFMQASSEQKKS